MPKAEYKRVRINGREVYVHRNLVKAKDGEVVHHKDGNKKNNSKKNLRKQSRRKHTALSNKKR